MRRVILLPALVVCTVFVGFGSRADEASLRLKEGTGRDLTTARCASCHSLDYIPMVAPAMNRAAWEKIVRKMIDAFGAPVEKQDATQIVEYLSEQYSSQEKSGV
jgi:sulfite dehydrogenase (cytochrome) subunit B